ncbi:MAG: large conductance mechanosensitive channel protein MscL [Bacteroidetes bacterium]|nr:large conductance mechanosensitive channel protein MscL [Bacteroidota bacterium]
MGLIKEFKEFAVGGNVMDLAVGLLIGAAFGKIVTSLVDDIIMPIVGIILQGKDFSKLSYKVGEAEVKYGNFIQVSINFIIIGLVLLMVVKALNKMKKKA